MRGQFSMSPDTSRVRCHTTLVASRHQPAPAFGLRVRRPDLRQVPRRLQPGERSGIDLVRLDVSLGDRLHLQRIGDNHPRHEWRQNSQYRHAVVGRIEHHLITGGQVAEAASY